MTDSDSTRRASGRLRRIASLLIILISVFASNGIASAHAEDPTSSPTPTPAPLTISECLAAGQVWLYVSYDQDVLSNQCVGNPSSGMNALAQGGLTVRTAKGGFVCSLDNIPNGCPSTSYWTYFHALADSGWAVYNYSDLGASSYTPAAGSIEAWCYSHDSSSEEVHCTPQLLQITSSDGTLVNPEGANPAVTTRPAVDPPSESPLATILVIAGVLVLAVVGMLWTRRSRRAEQSSGIV